MSHLLEYWIATGSAMLCRGARGREGGEGGVMMDVVGVPVIMCFGMLILLCYR
jgi:hypothetical protein